MAISVFKDNTTRKKIKEYEVKEPEELEDVEISEGEEEEIPQYEPPTTPVTGVTQPAAPTIEDVITETPEEMIQLFDESYLTTQELFNSDELAQQAANFAIARGVSPSADWLWKLGGEEHPVEEIKLSSGYSWIIGDYNTFDDDIFISPEGIEYSYSELTQIDDENLIEDVAGITGEAITEEQRQANIVAGMQSLFPNEDVQTRLNYYFGSEDEDIRANRVEEFQQILRVAGRTPETEKLLRSLWADISEHEMANVFGEDYLKTVINQSQWELDATLAQIASEYNISIDELNEYIEKKKEIVMLGDPFNMELKKGLDELAQELFGDNYKDAVGKIDTAFDTYWNNYGEFEGYSSFGRALLAGVGDIKSGVSGVAGWFNLDGIKESLSNEAERLQNVAPLLEDVDFTWKDATTGNFWRTIGLTVSRAIPFTIATLPLQLIGVGIGLQISNLLKISSPILRGIFGGAIGGTMSGLAEATLEAGFVYNDAISSGMSDEEASSAAETAFRNNALLLSLTNAAELFVGLKIANPRKTLNSVIARGLVTVSKSGKVALTEAGQEVLQEAIQKQALGQEVDWTSDDMKMCALVGGVMGVGIGTSLDAVSNIVNRAIANLPEDKRAKVKEIKDTLPDNLSDDQKNIKALEEMSGDNEYLRLFRHHLKRKSEYI
jgi:hypothetical protein